MKVRLSVYTCMHFLAFAVRAWLGYLPIMRTSAILWLLWAACWSPFNKIS